MVYSNWERHDTIGQQIKVSIQFIPTVYLTPQPRAREIHEWSYRLRFTRRICSSIGSIEILLRYPRLSIQIYLGQFPPSLAEGFFVTEILLVRLELKFWLVLRPELAYWALFACLERGRLERPILVDIFGQVQREHHDEVYLLGNAVAKDESELV